MDWKQEIFKCFEGPEHNQASFEGEGAFLDLYHRTRVPEDRRDLIDAIAQMIETSENPSTIARLIHIASSLDLAIDEAIQRFRDSGRFQNVTCVREATENYFAFLKLKTMPLLHLPNFS